VKVVAVGIGAFVAIGLSMRNEPVQTPDTSSPVQVAQYAKPQAGVKAEPTRQTDPAAKQRAINAELNRAIKQAIDNEVNRAIGRALSDTSEDDRKHRSDQEWRIVRHDKLSLLCRPIRPGARDLVRP
jgi:hypothetical protein